MHNINHQKWHAFRYRIVVAHYCHTGGAEQLFCMYMTRSRLFVFRFRDDRVYLSVIVCFSLCYFSRCFVFCNMWIALSLFGRFFLYLSLLFLSRNPSFWPFLHFLNRGPVHLQHLFYSRQTCTQINASDFPVY